MNYLEKNNPLGGKKWNMYEVTRLYFPEVHTTSYDNAEKSGREIEEWQMTDEETRARLLKM